MNTKRNNHKMKKSTKHTYKSQQLLLFIIIACNVDRARRFFLSFKIKRNPLQVKKQEE